MGVTNLNYKINPSDVATFVPETVAKLSHFNLSETLKTTIKPDYLYPVYHRELMPNDRVKVSVKSMSRILSMLTPNMDGIKLKFFAFWVPNRILWNHWLNFMGEETYQGDDIDYQLPTVNMNSASNAVGGLADYFGIKPTGIEIDYSVNALPFRAYNMIWNQWFKSNKLQAPVKEYSDDTEVNISEYKLLKIGKKADYFTECLPTPAAIDVEIGLTGNAQVYTDANKPAKFVVKKDDETNALMTLTSSAAGKFGTNSNIDGLVQKNPAEGVAPTNLYADMSLVSGVSIEALRHASALQVLYEKDNRAGNLYPDLMNIHFGVDIPDFLLGRSQFLGSTTTYINSEAVVNSTDTSNSPLGTLGGVGFGAQDDYICDFGCVEHGQFIILAAVASDVVYQQGLDRKWSRRQRFDYPFPEFFNLGEQPVLEREIFLDAVNAKSNKVFGYTPRYQDERRGIDKCTSLMRSGVTGTLDVWHLGQDFQNAPQLNSEFIESNTPLKRAVAVQDEDNILLHILFDVQCDRCLPINVDPSLLAGRL